MRSTPRTPTSRLAAGVIRKKRFVILAAAFHTPITAALAQGALRVLRQAGVPDHRIRVLQVPGAFELPVVAAHLARRRDHPDAIVAVGALIRGRTAQYAVLAHAAVQGLTQVAVTTGVPVTCGVIVAETMAQAQKRAGGSTANRGAEAAAAALAVVGLLEPPR